MPIVTRSKMKALLGITDTQYDIQILSYIPIIQQQIVDITNNDFLDDNVSYTASTIAFVNGIPGTITDSDSMFIDENFTNNIDIKITGSKLNNGSYYVESVVAGTLTLQNSETLVNESAGDTITIQKVRFPKSLEVIASKMIWFNIEGIKSTGKKSEKLGDYSYTNGDSGVNGGMFGYPSDIIAGLNPYLKVRYS